MPGILGSIAGLFHAAQQGIIEHALFGFSVGLGQQPLQFGRIDPVVDQGEFIAEAVDELLEIDQLGRIGVFVDAVQEGDVPVGDERRPPPRWRPA